MITLLSTVMLLLTAMLLITIIRHYNVSGELSETREKLQNQETLNRYLVKAIDDAYNQNIITQTIDQILEEAENKIN